MRIKRRVRRAGALLLPLILIAATVSGCANVLEGHVEALSPNERTPYVRPPVEQITVQDFDEYRELLQELILSHSTHTTIQYIGIDPGDMQAEITAISDEIMSSDPVVAYAVTDITARAARIVAYFEIDIEIGYRRSAEQIQAIVRASTRRYMITQLLEKMSQYEPEAIFLTNLQLDRDDIANQIMELYYQNPRRIVMRPFVTVEIFPDPESLPENPEPMPGGGEGAGGEGLPVPGAADDEQEFRIYEIRFWNAEEAGMLREIGESLASSVRQNAARADGENDGEILLSLVEILIAGATYDAEAANTITMHGPQNIAATAFGALVRGSAVGEGFAMAFKALCDALSLDCRVVLGRIGETYHAWNIVALDGYYYHIDAAMCAENGLETGFLKTDDGLMSMEYTWDLGSVPECNGPLTLSDLFSSGDVTDTNGQGGGDANGTEQ